MVETTVSVAVAHPNDAGVTAAVPAAASNRRLALWSTWKTSRNAQRRGDATMDPPPSCAGLLGKFIDAYVVTPRDFDVSYSRKPFHS